MFSCKIFERFVISGKFSSTCHDILGEYSSSKLLSLHSPKRTTILAAELLRISAKCVHVSSVIMHNSLSPLQGAPIKNNPQNFCIYKNSHPKRFYISEKKLKIQFRNPLHMQKCNFFYPKELCFIGTACTYHFSLYTASMMSPFTNSRKICSQINYIT